MVMACAKANAVSASEAMAVNPVEMAMEHVITKMRAPLSPHVISRIGR